MPANTLYILFVANGTMRRRPVERLAVLSTVFLGYLLIHQRIINDSILYVVQIKLTDHERH